MTDNEYDNSGYPENVLPGRDPMTLEDVIARAKRMKEITGFDHVEPYFELDHIYMLAEEVEALREHIKYLESIT